MRVRDIRSAGTAWVVAGVLLGFVAHAAAQGPMGERGPMGPPPGAGGGLPPIFMRADLSEEQRTQIRALVTEQRDAHRAEFEERRTVQHQLTAAIYGAGADAEQVSQLVTRLAELQKQALEEDAALQTKIAALLTEQQRQQIVEREGQGPGPGARRR